jgi:hypothetical protein
VTKVPRPARRGIPVTGACPLTDLAERYGAERGFATDVYLPGWFAHNIPAIHAPLLHSWPTCICTTGGERCCDRGQVGVADPFVA